LYGCDFRYEDIGISIRNGGFYYQRADKNFDNAMSARSCLSLENPMSPNINVAKAAFRFDKIKEVFENCYSRMIKRERRDDVSILNMLLTTRLSEKPYVLNTM